MTRDTKQVILLGLLIGLVLFLTFVKLSSWGLGEKLLLNEERFDQFIEIHFSSYETPAKDAGLKILKIDDDYIIHLIPSEEGLVVNKTLLKLELKEYLRNPPQPDGVADFLARRSDNVGGSPRLYLAKSYPEIEDFEVADARMKAYQILETPLKLSFNASEAKLQSTWEVPQEEVTSWIEFVPSGQRLKVRAAGLVSGQKSLGKDQRPTTNDQTGSQDQKPMTISGLTVSLDQEKIKNFITPLASEINREPINAELEIKNGKVVAFALSREGKRLEIEESAQIIADSADLSRYPRSPQESAESATIELVVSALTPQVTTESIENLGITTLIGKGESDFAGSPQNRIHNIKLSSAKLNGTLIKPGEEFSFNKTLGEVGPTEGYLPELVIKKDKVTPEFGGGICQVSTTLFRAALFSGLPITERFPHAFPVAYYWPQGMDATVYPPHPDLRFENDTPEHILIQRKIIGTKLIFEFFGTSEIRYPISTSLLISDINTPIKRSVKIKGPYVIEKKEDGSMKTVLYREIYYDGELVKEETFRSNYASPEKYPRE